MPRRFHEGVMKVPEGAMKMSLEVRRRYHGDTTEVQWRYHGGVTDVQWGSMGSTTEILWRFVREYNAC